MLRFTGTLAGYLIMGLFRSSYRHVDPKSGKVTRKRLAKWYIRYRDAEGIVRVMAAFRDKEASRQLEAKLVREAELGRAGVRDPFAEHRTTPISEHLEAFAGSLRARKNTAAHVTLVIGRVRKVMDGCGFIFLADLDSVRVETFLKDMREAGISTQTANHYLRAVKQFSRWLVRNRRMADDPMVPLSMVRVTDGRKRRALTEDELFLVVDAARAGKRYAGLTGDDRAMLYLAAAYTGLRASELASLTRTSFSFESEVPTVTVEAGYSKRRREDVVPLHPGLVAMLRLWLASRPPEGHLWPSRWAEQKRAARMLRRDLNAAGVLYVDEDGRVADFHALRHTFISRLGQAGVSVQHARELARHSDVNLTLARYTHLGLHDTGNAIACLPDPRRPDRSSREAQKATGTLGHHYAQHSHVSANQGNRVTTRANETEGESAEDTDPGIVPFPGKTLENAGQSRANPSGEGGIRAARCRNPFPQSMLRSQAKFVIGLKAWSDLPSLVTNSHLLAR